MSKQVRLIVPGAVVAMLERVRVDRNGRLFLLDGASGRWTAVY